MYPSKGTNPYGHQPYGTHQTYGQTPGSGGYGAPDASLSARLASASDADVAAYRGHAAPHGSQYGGGASSTAYNSSSLSVAQQVGGVGSKQPGSSSHTGLSGLGSNLAMTADDYFSTSSRGYGGVDYAALQRRHYSEHHAGYVPREMPADLERRYADPVGHSHQAASLRQQQLLKGQLPPSSDLSRQSDYYSPQDPYAARGPPEADPCAVLSILGSVPYRAGAQASLLATDLRRNDSLAASYGVSLPPGRDYSTTSATSIRDVLRDEDLRRNLLLREKEHERERERERDRVRDRERDREREREREKDREHKRERERERERERDWEREREKQQAREREKELERNLLLEPRRERSKDRRGSSVLHDDRSARRVSPRRDSVIRPRSPVREKKREYLCKVFPFFLVDAERDYPSLTKRYPKLAVAPDFSKVVLNWPKKNMDLSLYTPVSFEHDFVEVNGEGRSSTEKAMSPNKEEIVWNAKVLLMSGISNNALSELCSTSDERAIHLSHVLKFAIVRKDRELLAIGGSWNPTIDGGDPLVSDYGLIKAAIRHVKEATQVDLQGCQHWNRFLEIHYERVRKEGNGIRKEITVLFVPNMSDCIPAIEAWRTEWLAYRKALAEREQKEEKKHKEKKEEHNDENKELREGGKSSNKSENNNSPKNKRPTDKTGKVDSSKAEDRDNQAAASVKQIPIEKKEDIKTEINVENNKISTEVKADQEEAPMEDLGTAKKTVKKKIVKRVIKKKAPGDDASATATAATGMVKKEEIAAEHSKDEDSVQETDVAKTKKMVVKRVVKRKVVASGAKENVASARTEVEKDVKTEEEKKEEFINAASVVNKCPVKMEVEAEAPHKEKEKEKEENKKEKDKEKEKLKEKEKENEKEHKENDKEKEKEKDKEDKEKKSEPRSSDVKHKSSTQKDVKEKSKHEEPPRHPGFILQVMRNKGSRIRSTTISLGGLLDYNDKDIAESTFEISLFAESLNEMFQYQMGCRILSFLEKLRRHYIIKKNQKKREREREKYKDVEKESEGKRAKKSENKEKISGNTNDKENGNTKEKMEVDKPREENKVVSNSNKEENEEIEEEPEEEMEEEPEEIEEEPEETEEPEEIEEPEEMEEPEDVLDKDPVASQSTKNEDVNKPKEAENASRENDKKVVTGEDGKSKERSAKKADEETSSKEGKPLSEKKETVVDKELLQAFRYFDQNRVGYIKVEDLRCIIHNLGKFLSHRDVKEMVQIALFESNSARDNRIFYTRLVKISDL